MFDIFDHELDAKSPDRSGDATEHFGNPQKGLHGTVAWTENVNFVHDQGLQIGQPADKVWHSYRNQKGKQVGLDANKLMIGRRGRPTLVVRTMN